MMTQKQRDDLAVIITEAAFFYDREMDRVFVMRMIQTLQNNFPDKSFPDFASAFASYRKDPTNLVFPSPARLATFLRPVASEEAMANEAVSRIIHAVHRFGYSNGSDAMEYIGTLGWLAVRDHGGWSNLCHQLGADLSETMFRAQAREAIKAKVNLEKAGIHGKPIELESLKQRPAELQQPSGLTRIGFHKKVGADR